MNTQIISRSRAVELLVENDIDDIRQELNSSKQEPAYLISILENGCTGYGEMCVSQLQEELDNNFEDWYKINPEL